MSKLGEGRRNVGGSTAERGLDFQARVSAIVMAHMLIEKPLNWFANVLPDNPKELHAETGGPGDDICFVCEEGKLVEVQVKSGLSVGEDLWAALVALAKGIHTERIVAGVLVVCPNSSKTIRSNLADDIVRMGNGRLDGLRDQSERFLSKLNTESIDVVKACSALRIITISAVEGNQEAENNTRERLASVVQNSSQAWISLVAYSRRLIKIRGRATRVTLTRELRLRNIHFKTSQIETSIQLQAALNQWLQTAFSNIKILGISKPVPIKDCWIPITAFVVEADQSEPLELEKALSKYHEYASRHRHGGQSVDAHTVGRYVRKAVVLGGPGIGKSTLLKKLALEYSRDGFLVLFVRLPQVVALMRQEGGRLEDCLFEIALSASGLRSNPLPLHDAVILCDGLDECGNFQSMLIEVLHAFAAAHPHSRIIIASRPIGYQSGLLGDWRHYELQPLHEFEAENAISTVLSAIPFSCEEARETALELAKQQLKERHINGVAARSPLMLTMIAALVSKGIEPNTNRAALYRQLFRLIEDHPPARFEGTLPSEPERNRFLELLGWSFFENGNEPFEQIIERCARWWHNETNKGHLECQITVRNCLNYWEALGVVERIRTSTQETVTFVHKTFGEFAAAKYICSCDLVTQRDLIAKAIATPAWKETLSFTSHLGQVDTVLNVWSEMAEEGNSKATYNLDDALALVVQSGVPVATESLTSFLRCCWAVTANKLSKARYVGGDTLCLVAESNWPAVREDVFANINSSDNWVKLVAWACLCASSEMSVSYKEILEFLINHENIFPEQSYLGGLDLSSKGYTVRKSIIIGVAKKLLINSQKMEGLEVLNTFLIQTKWLSLGISDELAKLYKDAGQVMPIDLKARGHTDFYSSLEKWNSIAESLMGVICDKATTIEANDQSDEDMLELGALLASSNFWEMPSSSINVMRNSVDRRTQRQAVLQAIARASGIDWGAIEAQARVHLKHVLEREPGEYRGLTCIPRVDAIPDSYMPRVGSELLPVLTEVILHENEYFVRNAVIVLFGYRDDPLYQTTIQKLLNFAEGMALHYVGVLVNSLPKEQSQPLLLSRLISTPMTRGCEHLYPFLSPPFGFEYEPAVLAGLACTDPDIAAAAAKIASRLQISPELLVKFHNAFNDWKELEEPYPVKGGAVPVSPRDELAKIFVRENSSDISMLVSMIQDTRPDIRNSAFEPFIALLTTSDDLKDYIIGKTVSGEFEITLLRKAISAGAFKGNDAMKVVPLLQNCSAKVRFGVLPILNKMYLHSETIRAEAERLILDPNIEIRETAQKALLAVRA